MIGLPERRPSGRPVCGSLAQLFEVVGEALRAHAVGALVDIDELRVGARLADRLHGGDERMRDRDHGVAAPDARRHQGEPNRVGAVGHADAVLGRAVGGKLPLEALDLRTADEGG